MIFQILTCTFIYPISIAMGTCLLELYASHHSVSTNSKLRILGTFFGGSLFRKALHNMILYLLGYLLSGTKSGRSFFVLASLTTFASLPSFTSHLSVHSAATNPYRQKQCEFELVSIEEARWGRT